MRELERRVLLSVLDRKWREHLYEMDYLREGIGLRAYSQRDPLVEYQREGFDMFAAMMDGIKEESVGFLFNLEVQVEDDADEDEVERRGRPSAGREPVAAQAAPPARASPLIRAKGLERPGGPQNLSYSAPVRGRRGRGQPRRAAEDDEFAGSAATPVPLRLGQEVQAVPRRPGGPTGLTARIS